jgi:hypothetical protein
LRIIGWHFCQCRQNLTHALEYNTAVVDMPDLPPGPTGRTAGAHLAKTWMEDRISPLPGYRTWTGSAELPILTVDQSRDDENLKHPIRRSTTQRSRYRHIRRYELQRCDDHTPAHIPWSFSIDTVDVVLPAGDKLQWGYRSLPPRIGATWCQMRTTAGHLLTLL